MRCYAVLFADIGFCVPTTTQHRQHCMDVDAGISNERAGDYPILLDSNSDESDWDTELELRDTAGPVTRSRGPVAAAPTPNVSPPSSSSVAIAAATEEPPAKVQRTAPVLSEMKANRYLPYMGMSSFLDDPKYAGLLPRTLPRPPDPMHTVCGSGG